MWGVVWPPSLAKDIPFEATVRGLHGEDPSAYREDPFAYRVRFLGSTAPGVGVGFLFPGSSICWRSMIVVLQSSAYMSMMPPLPCRCHREREPGIGGVDWFGRRRGLIIDCQRRPELLEPFESSGTGGYLGAEPSRPLAKGRR